MKEKKEPYDYYAIIVDESRFISGIASAFWGGGYRSLGWGCYLDIQAFASISLILSRTVAGHSWMRVGLAALSWPQENWFPGREKYVIFSRLINKQNFHWIEKTGPWMWMSRWMYLYTPWTPVRFDSCGSVNVA
jgi:hypothetical protein